MGPQRMVLSSARYNIMVEVPWTLKEYFTHLFSIKYWLLWVLKSTEKFLNNEIKPSSCIVHHICSFN